jgi:hypothetical protein
VGEEATKPLAVRSASRTRMEGIGKAEEDRIQALAGANIRGRSMTASTCVVTFEIVKLSLNYSSPLATPSLNGALAAPPTQHLFESSASQYHICYYLQTGVTLLRDNLSPVAPSTCRGFQSQKR